MNQLHKINILNCPHCKKDLKQNYAIKICWRKIPDNAQDWQDYQYVLVQLDDDGFLVGVDAIQESGYLCEILCDNCNKDLSSFDSWWKQPTKKKPLSNLDELFRKLSTRKI